MENNRALSILDRDSNFIKFYIKIDNSQFSLHPAGGGSVNLRNSTLFQEFCTDVGSRFPMPYEMRIIHVIDITANQEAHPHRHAFSGSSIRSFCEIGVHLSEATVALEAIRDLPFVSFGDEDSKDIIEPSKSYLVKSSPIVEEATTVGTNVLPLRLVT